MSAEVVEQIEYRIEEVPDSPEKWKTGLSIKSCEDLIIKGLKERERLEMKRYESIM